MIFLVALRKELLEQWRSYRLFIVVVVLLLFGGLMAPLSVKYTPELLKALAPNGEEIAKLIPAPTATAAVEEYVGNIGQFGVLAALLVTMGAVAQEKDKGTAALMLVKPLPRGVFLAAKFVALGITFTISVLVAAVACYYYTMLLFESLDVASWLALNGLMLLFLLVYVALTLFCSTLSRSQLVGGGLAFGLLMVLTVRRRPGRSLDDPGKAGTLILFPATNVPRPVFDLLGCIRHPGRFCHVSNYNIFLTSLLSLLQDSEL
jgi:ABC-2 type transport system permease protein